MSLVDHNTQSDSLNKVALLGSFIVAAINTGQPEAYATKHKAVLPLVVAACIIGQPMLCLVSKI